MTDSQAYIAFNLTDKVGFATVEKLAQEAGGVVAAWERYPRKVSRTGGEVEWEREEELAAKRNVKLVTLADEEYPAHLKSAPGAPLVLYVKGDVSALKKPALALVGTRRATQYGLSIAHNLAYDLAQAGWSIVSGLALGIDAASHRGALEAKGVTVGVIGSGLDRFFPEENLPLAREMVENGGAVVSEFPFGKSADQTTFPIRNHVVAALARGVIAVESPAKSGTLITTSIAADLGRTVMAVPGRIDSRASVGCNGLIREGAILVRNADDVLEAMSELFPPSMKRTKSPVEEQSAPDLERPTYSVEEAMVMLHVDEDGISIDDLVRKTGLKIDKVNSLVMTLRLKGFLKFLPGNRVGCV